MMHAQNISAAEALQRLKEGNQKYIEAEKSIGTTSSKVRLKTLNYGQHPYAIIVACSDSRAIPESIFHAGIGDLFVIRVAGNVIDDHQLGSIEYAADHLGTRLIVVLGHDHCGAVDAAMNHDPDGYIKYITDEVRIAIGEETDEVRACCLNVRHSVEMIERNLDIQKMEDEDGMRVMGALYHLDSGEVEFL